MKKNDNDRTAQELTDEELLFLIRYRYDDPIGILIHRYSPLIASTAQRYFLTGYEAGRFNPRSEYRLIPNFR